MTKEQFVAVIKANSDLEVQLDKMESLEDVQSALAAKGIVTSTEEIADFVGEALSSAQLSDGELNDEDLENVTGGITLKQVTTAWKVGARIGIGLRMVYDYYTTGKATTNYSWKQLATGSIFG